MNPRTLKPCPFCGGKRPAPATHRISAGEVVHFVVCTRQACGARGPWFTQFAEFQRPDPEAQAVDGWNRRA